MQAWINVPLGMNVYVCVRISDFRHDFRLRKHLFRVCLCAAYYVQAVNGHIIDRFKYIFQLLL